MKVVASLSIATFVTEFLILKKTQIWVELNHSDFIIILSHVIHVIFQMDRNSVNDCYCLKSTEQGVVYVCVCVCWQGLGKTWEGQGGKKFGKYF